MTLPNAKLSPFLWSGCAGLVFGLITVAANRLPYPGIGVVSLIIGSNYGWILWAFLVGFTLSTAGRFQPVLGGTIGALSLVSAVLTYEITDGLLYNVSGGPIGVMIDIFAWSIAGTVTGFVFGALGSLSHGISNVSTAFLFVSAALIMTERLLWFRLETSYPEAHEPYRAATIVSLIILGIVTGCIFLWQKGIIPDKKSAKTLVP